MTKRILSAMLPILLFHGAAPAAAPGWTPEVKFGNGLASAAFHAVTGDWTGLWFADAAGENLIRRPDATVDCVVDGRPLLGESGRRAISVTADAAGRSVTVVFEKDGIRVTQTAAWDEDAPVLRQRVRVECLRGGPRALTSVHYRVPALAVGQAASCLVQAPGQILAPDSPYPDCASRPLDRSWNEPVPWYPQGWLECAPDQTSGLVAVENRGLGRVVSAWLHSDTATAFPTLDGRGAWLDLGHRHQIAAWLKPGVSVSSGTHIVMLTAGSWSGHLQAFRAAAYSETSWHAAAGQAPEWLRDARLLQIDPRPVKVWTDRLDAIRESGFNVVYCMPVWKNQGNLYALLDHFRLDDKQAAPEDAEQWRRGSVADLHANPHGVGTEEELREFVLAAHRRGLRVFFDFIPQGIGVKSPFVRAHPDWLVKDALGRPFASHGWGPSAGQPAESGTYSCDWGNPEYRAFAVEWALWNVRAFGIDGFRMDAMHWKEANFDPANPRPAYATTFGGLRLIEELRAAVRSLKPDFVLLSEVWGPVFNKVSDGTYENGWLLKAVNEGWLRGKPVFTGAQWARALADAEAARPAGTVRAAFSANHDIQELVDMARGTAMGAAVSTVHALSGGIPFVWYRELEGRESFFRSLMRQRAGLRDYSRNLQAVSVPDPDLFGVLWTSPGKRPRLVLANLSYSPVSGLARLGMKAQSAEVLFGGAGCKFKAEEQGLNIFMPGAGYAVIQL